MLVYEAKSRYISHLIPSLCLSLYKVVWPYICFEEWWNKFFISLILVFYLNLYHLLHTNNANVLITIILALFVKNIKTSVFLKYRSLFSISYLKSVGKCKCSESNLVFVSRIRKSNTVVRTEKCIQECVDIWFQYIHITRAHND